MNYVEESLGWSEFNKTLLSSRHDQQVWRVGTAGESAILREGKSKRIEVHAEVLKVLEGKGIAPKLYASGAGYSIEEDLCGLPLRAAHLPMQTKIARLLDALEVLHDFKSEGAIFKNFIFERYASFFEEVPEEREWLKQHFPDEGEYVLLHGACNFTNAVWAHERVYLIDFCDSYSGPKECDLGSVFFSEFFDCALLQDECTVNGYDFKKTIYYAALYAVKQLGKKRDSKIESLVRERLYKLKRWYLEKG